MPMLNWFWPFSGSWHVPANYDIKNTMQSMGMHDVAVHDIGVHDVGMHSMGKHSVGVLSVGVHKTLHFSAVKK